MKSEWIFITSHEREQPENVTMGRQPTTSPPVEEYKPVLEYKIGELASLTSCPVETIRYYEKQGLLPAASRNQANYRVYQEGHLKRLQFILHCRALDMTQEEIRLLVTLQDKPDSPCEQVDVLLDNHLQHVEARITQLQHLQEQLRLLRSQCDNHGPVSRCGIIEGLERLDVSTDDHHPDDTCSHVHGSHGL